MRLRCDYCQSECDPGAERCNSCGAPLNHLGVTALDYRREFKSAPDPLAAYGYTSMALVLDAISRAGGAGRDRERVIRELFDTNDYDSVVGKFSIDDNGDTTLQRVAGYRVRNGRLEFVKGLDGSPSG